MWVIGPVSSLFDFLTFYVLLAVLHADETLFQTGWFIESLATQVLVIFVIRTRAQSAREPAASRARGDLARRRARRRSRCRSPDWARYFGFQPPPAEFFVILAALSGRLPGDRRGHEADVLQVPCER